MESKIAIGVLILAAWIILGAVISHLLGRRIVKAEKEKDEAVRQIIEQQERERSISAQDNGSSNFPESGKIWH